MNEGIQALRKLRSTRSAENNGAYHQAREYSQIRVESTMSLIELEDWLYARKWKAFEYVGVVVASSNNQLAITSDHPAISHCLNNIKQKESK